MKNQVTVAKHPITGLVVTMNEEASSNGKIYGQFRVDQEVEILDNFGYRLQKRSAFKWVESSSADAIYEGKTFEGKIIRRETRTPQYPGHKAKINPSTKETVLVDGAPVYMQDIFTNDLNAQDELIKPASAAVSAKIALKV